MTPVYPLRVRSDWPAVCNPCFGYRVAVIFARGGGGHAGMLADTDVGARGSRNEQPRRFRLPSETVPEGVRRGDRHVRRIRSSEAPLQEGRAEALQDRR